MPQAPDNYKPPSVTKTENIARFKEKNDPTRHSPGPNQYSHRRYRKWRQRMKEKQRAVDEQRVHELYSSLDSKSYSDYMNWLGSDNPMCVHCIDEGNIKQGRVLDHVQPINQGGSKHDEDNLQWLCDHHHAIKSSVEDSN